jgi:hypothetical protein
MADEANIDNVTPLIAGDETPETTPETRVTYTPEQQKHLEGLLKLAQNRAAKELRAELARAKEETAAKAAELSLYQQGQTPELIEARQQLAAEKAARAAAEDRQTAAEKRVLLREEAQLADIISPADAARLLGANVVHKDGRFVVVDDQGEPRVNDAGEPLQVRDLVREFAAARPYAVRSRTLPGTGSSMNSGGPVRQPVPLSRLFGPKAEGRLVFELSKDMRAYREAKARAQAEGLI